MDPRSRGREVARDVLRSLPKAGKCLLFTIGERSIFFVVCLVYTRGKMFFFSQTPGRCPPHTGITGLRVNSVTLIRRVGAPNERAPFRFHDAIIAGFADRCLTRIRIADQGLGGRVHERRAGFARAIKLRVSCPGELKK